MLLTQVPQDGVQVPVDGIAKVIILGNMRGVQCAEVQIHCVGVKSIQNLCPDHIDVGIDGLYLHRRETVDIDLCVRQKFYEFRVHCHFAEQARIERLAFQHLDHFITQMQFVQSCVWVIFYFCQAQKIIGGNAVEPGQRHDAAVADVLAVLRLVASQRRF